MKLRFYLSIVIAQLAYLFLKITKLSSGTAIIGLLTLKICPNFLNYANEFITSSKIYITGTNGKTTTSGILSHLIKILWFLQKLRKGYSKSLHRERHGAVFSFRQRCHPIITFCQCSYMMKKQKTKWFVGHRLSQGKTCFVRCIRMFPQGSRTGKTVLSRYVKL